MKTLLVTPESVIKYTPLRAGIDNDVINPKIEVTQDLTLAYVIGYPLMKKLQVVVDDPSEDNPDERYTTLLNDYVAPYLRWATAYNLLPDIAYSLSSGGAQLPESNQGQNIFDGQMAIVKQNILSNASGYKKLLLDYLCDKSSIYPEYATDEQGKQNRSDSGKPFHGIEFY
jgi:hypothetical protein